MDTAKSEAKAVWLIVPYPSLGIELTPSQRLHPTS